MAPRAKLVVPSYAPLPHSHSLPPKHPTVHKALSKLSRSSLISLALEWLDSEQQTYCRPYLTEDVHEDEGINRAEDDVAPYDPADSIEEAREVYEDLKARKGGKKEVVDRITEGEWRRGLSLYQLAMVECQQLSDQPTSRRWNALRLSRISSSDGEASKDSAVPSSAVGDHLPRFHAPTFLLNLQRELATLTKAHYYLTKAEDGKIALLRVYLYDSPYDSHRGPKGSHNASEVVFLAFPHGSPFVYISMPGRSIETTQSDARSLRKMVLEAVPRAFSRPQARYRLQTTAFMAMSLSALLSLRGPGRSNAAAGGWSIYAEDSVGHSPLDYTSACPTAKQVARDNGNEEEKEGHGSKRTVETSQSPSAKRRRLIAEGRFGCSGIEGDGKGIERFDVRINDPFPDYTSASGDKQRTENSRASIESEDSTNGDEPSTAATKPGRKGGRRPRPSLLDRTMSDDEQGSHVDASESEWRPDVRVSFQGSHVFAGIRQLVERGIIDGERMPGWMTGEAGVSVGVVRNGRIMARRDHGL